MGQTTSILPRTKKIYKKIFNSPIIDQIAKKILTFLVDFFALIKKWNFPEKYSWDWKLEMLLHKYEQDTVDVFKKIIKPGMIVVDIGAHIGYYTKLFSKLVGPQGHVYAFEADDENFSLLAKNTKRFRNVSIINKAIANKNDTITFYKVSGSTGCHSIVASTLPSTQIIVPSITLDTFLQKNNIDTINIIKIDIEGGEPLAFSGMRELFSKNQNLMVISEFFPQALITAGIQPIAFLESIQNDGFTIYQILKSGELKSLSIENIKNLEFYRTGYANLLFQKEHG